MRTPAGSGFHSIVGFPEQLYHKTQVFAGNHIPTADSRSKRTFLSLTPNSHIKNMQTVLSANAVAGRWRMYAGVVPVQNAFGETIGEKSCSQRIM
jgi:hypothetical protein